MLVPAGPLPAATLRRVARVVGRLALAAGVGASALAVWGEPSGAARLALAALAGAVGALGTGLWAAKWAALGEAAAALPALGLARPDWVPPPGAVGGAANLARVVPLPPLAAALAAGVPPPHAVAAWLAELVRRHVLRLATVDPPVLVVGTEPPADPWTRLAVTGPSGTRVDLADAAPALLAHAAIELHRRLAGAPVGPSGAWFATAFVAAARDGAADAPWPEGLTVGPVSRGFARDCGAALDPAGAPATPWAPVVAAALAPHTAGFVLDAPVAVCAPPDAWHTAACADAAAGGAVVAGA